MGLSIKITNTRCIHGCVYCYEHALRSAGPSASDRPLDLDKVMAQMEKEWREQTQGGRYQSAPPYLHGGEALSAGHEVVEVLLRKSFELAGHTNIQTYGYLIDDRYIEMFKKYRTEVGISIDGPWPLNKARVTPDLDGREVTETVIRNIYKLRANGIHVSIICVLHKLNALPEPRKRLKEWILELRSIGVTSGRLNLMHTDYHRYGKALELTEDEAADAWRDLTRFVLQEHDGLNWQPMRDAVDILMGLTTGTCIFGPTCVYYHAAAEPVILSDGHTTNCLKTGKRGHMYPRYEQWDGDFRGFGGVRYEILPLTPQEYGGCAGCKYWRECAGGCPSEGVGGDWRNKTRFCKAYYALFEEAEKVLRRVMPNIRLSVDVDPREFSGNTVVAFSPPSFYLMDRNYTGRPSSWRGDARALLRSGNRQAMQVPVRPSRQVDDYGHRDHGDHTDTDPSLPATQQQAMAQLPAIEMRLKELSESLRKRSGQSNGS